MPIHLDSLKICHTDIICISSWDKNVPIRVHVFAFTVIINHPIWIIALSPDNIHLLYENSIRPVSSINAHTELGLGEDRQPNCYQITGLQSKLALAAFLVSPLLTRVNV